MRILLLGKNGQVGWELERTLAPLGEVVALGRAEADLSKLDKLRSIVRQQRPQVIVNAAAYSDVDRAESEPDLAMVVNATAPGVLAEEGKALGACLIHISTDYVFDGQKRQPYVETDLPNPKSVYGKTKLAGEEAIRDVGGAYLILRTSWIYSLRGDSFVTKVLAWARTQEVLRVVDDQVACPTWARMLAETTAQVVVRRANNLQKQQGLYHIAGDGSASRLDWARSILKFDPQRSEHVLKEVVPARTSDFPTIAERPLFSALDCSRFAAAFGLGLPEWEPSLKLAMAEKGA